MSRVLKSFSVLLDPDNVINVEVPDFDFFNSEELVEEDEPSPISEEEALTKAEQIIKDAEEQALRIAETAKDEAAHLVAEMKEEAQRQIDTLKEEARKEAYEEGKAEGDKEAAKIIEHAESIKTDALIEKNRILNSAEPEVIALISDIVKKLIGAAYEIHPQIIKHLVRLGLDASTVSGDIVVHVSESDYDTILSAKHELTARGEAGTRLEIVKDETLSPSDCIIETNYGNIDCSLGQQYEGLSEALYFILYAKRTGGE